MKRGDPAISRRRRAPPPVTSQPLDATAAPNGDTGDEDEGGALEVFRNRPFLLLWLAQAFTQIGGNMVIYGLTVIILEATQSNTAVSLLILTFLAAGGAVLRGRRRLRRPASTGARS